MDNANNAALNRVIDILMQKKPTNANKPNNNNNNNNINAENLEQIAKAVISTYNALNDKMLEAADITEAVVNKYFKLIETTKAIDTVGNRNSAVVDIITNNFDSLFKQFEAMNVNINNINTAAQNFNLDIVSNQIKKTMSSAATESADLGNKFEQEINKQLLTRTASKSTTIIARSVDNFFNRMKNNLQAPFKIAADIIQLPKRLTAGIKDLVSSVKENISSFKDGLLTGDFSSLFMSDKDKDDQAKVGISKRAIDINKVLRFSTAGISTAWLYTKLEKLLENISEDQISSFSSSMENNSPGLMNSFTTGGIQGLVSELFRRLLSSSIMTQILSTLKLIAAPVALIASAIGLTYAVSSSRDAAARARGDTAEKVLGTKGPASNTQRNIVTGAQRFAGYVGEGTSTERTVNGVKNAAIWGTIGTLAGGALGSFLGPAGTVAGAAFGAKLGAAVGGLTGIIGDKQLAKGIDTFRLGVIDLYNGSGNFKKTIEKITDSSKILFEGFFEGLKNIWDRIKKWIPGLAPNDDPKSPKSPKEPGKPKNDPKKPHIDNNFKADPILLRSAVQYITANEGGGAGAVNRDDGGTGASVGSLNWNGNRLKEYLYAMRDKDRKTFDAAMGPAFVNKMLNHGDNWYRNGIVYSAEDDKNWKKMIIEQKKMKPEDAKLLKVDEQIARRDVESYLQEIDLRGITDPRAKIILADYKNRNGSLPALNGKKSYEDIYNIIRSKGGYDAGRLVKPHSQKMLEYWGSEEAKIANANGVVDINLSKNQAHYEQTKAEALASAQAKANDKVLQEAIKLAAASSAQADDSKDKTNIKNDSNTNNNTVITSSTDSVPIMVLNYVFGLNIGGETMKSGGGTGSW